MYIQLTLFNLEKYSLDVNSNYEPCSWTKAFLNHFLEPLESGLNRFMRSCVQWHKYCSDRFPGFKGEQLCLNYSSSSRIRETLKKLNYLKILSLCKKLSIPTRNQLNGELLSMDKLVNLISSFYAHDYSGVFYFT